MNLYAGIGGNRANWDGQKHDITALEKNPEIAAEYERLYPGDQVIKRDAHQYLKENYQDFDFIWSSPPCPSHSMMRKIGVKKGQYEPVYPDMQLYEEILFLQEYFEGDFVVENVATTWYDPLIKPQKASRHYFWASFPIPKPNISTQHVCTASCKELRNWLGVEVKENWETVEQRKVLRNAVHPFLGQKILEARNKRQTTLQEVEQSE